MKYTILIFSLLFLGLNNSFAQTQFNLKGGFNFTQVNEDYEDGKIDGKAGYQIGMELRIGDRLYVSPGLYYFKSQSRIDFSENTLISLPEYKVNFEGLRIPLFLGGDLIEGENWGFRFYAGPNASMILSTNDGLPGYEDGAFNDLLWGFNAGLGVDLGVLTLDLSREWRLNNVFNGDSPEFRDNIVYLSVGLLF